MKNTGTMQLTTPSDREVRVIRVFDAPRTLVWDAMTRPELLKRWLFGPPGWALAVCTIDLRVGGKYRYEWTGPEGVFMAMGGVFREVAPPERLVTTQLFDEDWTGGEAVGTLVLTEKDGKTTLTNTILYSSKEARDTALSTPMEHGMAVGYDRVADILAMSRGGLRGPGEFCWINMLTPNPADACAFFGQLLGWTYGEIPGHGHSIKVGGRDIGGLFDLNGPNTPPGIPPMIGVTVKVEDADAVGARVTALGGKAMPAFDIMDAGRMAVCFDPNGAQFDVWQPRKMQGTDVNNGLHGAPSWFETLTTDVPRATKFYADLFGWIPETMPMPGGMYTTFKHGPSYVAGMMAITPQMGNFPPHWGTYFTVEDADATAREASRLGATICVPPHDIPGIGRFCGITSPQGVMFYVFQYKQ